MEIYDFKPNCDHTNLKSESIKKMYDEKLTQQ